MHGTKEERRVRYVWTWLDRVGGHPPADPITEQTWLLLTRRLMLRRRLAVATACALGVAGVATLVVLIRTAGVAQFVLAGTVLCLGSAVCTTAFQVLVARGDRLESAALPQRIARSAATSFVGTTGALRAALLAATSVCVLVPLVALCRFAVLDGSPVVGAAALAAVLAGVTLLLSVRHAVTRPSIAIDPVSLGVDDRLRWTDLRPALQLPLAVIAAANGYVLLHRAGVPWLLVLVGTQVLAVVAAAGWDMLNRRPCRPVIA